MGKKIGYFFYSLTPAIACIALQLLVGVVVAVVYVAVYLLQADMENQIAVAQAIADAGMAASAPSVFCYHIVGIVVFGLWYYFGCGRPKPAKLKTMANAKFWGSAVLAALAFISVNYTVMYILYQCFPQMVESYSEMWGSLQMSNMGLMYIATIFLAPIGEELMLRGVTLNIAQKCTKHFWVANVIQAFLFGLIHLNFIQGTYAFLGGLLLGWLYHKYNSLYIVILVHFLVNLSASTWADAVFGRVPEDFRWWTVIIIGIVAVLAVLAAWNGAFRKKEAAEVLAAE